MNSMTPGTPLAPRRQLQQSGECVAASGQWCRMGWRIMAAGCVGLGAAGAVLPLVPTTPFLLVAAWAGDRGWPGLTRRLEAHPRVGPGLRAWRRHRAIPGRVRILACAMLAMSWLLLWGLGMPTWALVVVGTGFLAVAAYVATRPSPPECQVRQDLPDRKLGTGNAFFP